MKFYERELEDWLQKNPEKYHQAWLSHLEDRYNIMFDGETMRSSFHWEMRQAKTPGGYVDLVGLQLCWGLSASLTVCHVVELKRAEADYEALYQVSRYSPWFIRYAERAAKQSEAAARAVDKYLEKNGFTPAIRWSNDERWDVVRVVVASEASDVIIKNAAKHDIAILQVKPGFELAPIIVGESCIEGEGFTQLRLFPTNRNSRNGAH